MFPILLLLPISFAIFLDNIANSSSTFDEVSSVRRATDFYSLSVGGFLRASFISYVMSEPAISTSGVVLRFFAFSMATTLIFHSRDNEIRKFFFSKVD